MDRLFNPLDYPTIFTYPERLTHHSAWLEHIPFGMFLVGILKPQVIVELGAHNGESYCALCQAVKELRLDARCYAVDTWQGDEHAGFYGAEILANLRAHHDPRYGSFSRLIQSTFDEALRHFTDGSVDLLHIDGMHTYEAVRHDFEAWRPKLSARGVVLFHDTNVREHGFGVHEFWGELKARHPHFEFTHGHGLGVLAVGEPPPPELRGLLNATPAEAVAVRNFFYQLGRGLTQESEYRRQLALALDAQAQEHELAVQSLNAAQAQMEQALNSQLQMLSAQVTDKEQQLEKLTASLSWRLRNRALAAYMKVPYPVRRVVTGFVRRLVSAGASKSALPPPGAHDQTEAKKKVSLIEAPNVDQKAAVVGTDDLRGAGVDVIVPVYRGVEETLACLHSVLGAQTTTVFELIVLNDASPEAPLVARLDELAAQGKLTLLHNDENLGFVRTVNRGMRLHPQRDVVLLNSDTEVNGDWLDRLARAAYAAADIGTVTPFSNNATICSYPATLQENALPPDAGLARLDRLCAQLNAAQAVSLPTAVGFCMYIRRACLNEVGYFDEEHFGKGYGEESDFCMRGMRRGWRHLLAADTFVYHAGSVSFGAGNSEIKERAAQVLSKLHSDYDYLVQQHIAANPARRLRRNLDVGRLAGPQQTMLFITPDPDGVARHLHDLPARLIEEGIRPLILSPVDPGQVKLEHPLIAPLPNLVFDLEKEYAELLSTLKALGVFQAHFHGTLELSANLLEVVKDLGLPCDVTLHDDGETESQVCNACAIIQRERLDVGRLFDCESSEEIARRRLSPYLAISPVPDARLAAGRHTPAVITETIRADAPALLGGELVAAVISGTVGAARRYRCEQRAAELRLAGIDARVFECDAAGLEAAQQQATLALLHRVPWSREVAELIAAVQRRGGQCIYDTDDLIFHPEHMRWLHFSGPDAARHEAEHRALAASYLATLRQCDAIFTSTQPLADEVAAATGKTAYVVRNALSEELLRLSQAAIQTIAPASDGALLIGYLSGTPTHDLDLAEAIPGLVKLLQTNRRVTLALVGFADVTLFPPAVRQQLLSVPFQNWQALPDLTRRLDLVIAPLEPNNPFTACKSEVKYMEAGAVGVPIIATATEAFQTAISDGRNGWLVEPGRSADWFEQLTVACRSREQRLAVGDAARQDCLRRYTAQVRGAQLSDILHTVLGSFEA